jgi:hypothetical protein
MMTNLTVDQSMALLVLAFTTGLIGFAIVWMLWRFIRHYRKLRRFFNQHARKSGGR